MAIAQKSKSFLYVLLSGACLIATSASVQADWLDDMDKQFEDTFVKTDAAFDKAMRDGVAELDKELADIWGDARQLPDAKVWVGYNREKDLRVIVDYDKGEIAVEGFDRTQEDLVKDFQDVLLEDSHALDERDRLHQKLIEKTKRLSSFRTRRSAETKMNSQSIWQKEEDEKIFKTEQSEKSEAQPSKRPIIKWKRERELSTLIQPRTRPTFVKRAVVFREGKKATLARLTLPLRKDRDQLSAQSLRGPVLEAAQKYRLPRSLILSVIKNESAFNPRARSHANALGLMQLVPTSGGKEAYSYLIGYEATPGPDILYDPYENIMLGATYLHLLNTRYFGDVADEQTRQYLIISAYNTGAGNVAKAFTGDMKLRPAIEKINAMSPEQVFAHLQKHLPYAETRTYLARVATDTETFASWDT